MLEVHLAYPIHTPKCQVGLDEMELTFRADRRSWHGSPSNTGQTCSGARGIGVRAMLTEAAAQKGAESRRVGTGTAADAVPFAA
jgi:hypothetical protein